jgi:hypothetical protein
VLALHPVLDELSSATASPAAPQHGVKRLQHFLIDPADSQPA